MSSIINTNITSLNAQRNTSMSANSLATSMQRLSSGLRVNSSKDDAAGLAIASRMDSQVRGMNVAQRNANDAISLSQTADGALSSVTDSLQRMRELTVEAANGTVQGSDRESLNKEFGQLAKEVQRVLGGTTFNGQAILGSQASTMNFQVGANTSANDVISVAMTDLTTNSTITDVTSSTNGIGSAASSTDISSMLKNLDTALNTINDERATLGAVENRFSAVVSNLSVSIENQTAAKSRIMDADFAAETANLSRAQILQQAGNAMIAQANSQPQNVLKLLQ